MLHFPGPECFRDTEELKEFDLIKSKHMGVQHKLPVYVEQLQETNFQTFTNVNKKRFITESQNLVLFRIILPQALGEGGGGCF